jgi:hypothetical protein
VWKRVVPSVTVGGAYSVDVVYENGVRLYFTATAVGYQGAVGTWTASAEI